MSSWRRPLFALRLALLLVWFTATAAAPRGGRKKKPKVVGTLEHFEAFCRKFLVLDNGKSFTLEPFQRVILAGYFAGKTETLVLLPKKNGKTTLLAALALYHLIYTPDAACYIAASAKDQAKIMYAQACGFVERKRDGKLLPQARLLQQRVVLKKGSKEIRSRRDSGFIWVLSGDVNTADGVIPTLALVDELHRHKDNGALYGVLMDGLGPRNGQIITISTAGESHKSALGKARRKALRMRGLRREGKYTTVESATFVMHEWSLDEEDDRSDLRLVKQVNPLSNNTLAKLRGRKKSPHMTPSRWARFACGVWMQGDDAAISALDWGRCASKKKLTPGASIYIGLDIGWTWDTTAAVPCEPYGRETVTIDGEEGWTRYRHVRFGTPKILIPPGDGSMLSREAVIGAVLHFREQGYEILGVVFDRNAEGRHVAQELEELHGIPVIDYSQAPASMAVASMGLAEAIGAKEVEQPDDPEFNSHILAARARTTSGELWRFEAPERNRGQRKKGKQDGDSVEYVDAAVSAAMVRQVATSPEPPAIDISDYRMEFIDP